MYSKQLSSAEPGLIIIMIDQSTSMTDSYGKKNKAEFAALAVNRVMENIIAKCSSGDLIKDRVQVAVIGYGSNAKVLFLEKASELAKNKNVVEIPREQANEMGEIETIMEPMRVWVNPKASGGTAMDQAFSEAKKGAEMFIKNNPNSFPPVIINVTDGEPNEWYQNGNFDKTKKAAKELLGVKTSDGNAIILNAHISTDSGISLELPSSNKGFVDNPYANFLYEISSELPAPLIDAAVKAGFSNVKDGSKGFVYNADGTTLIRVLNFGSTGGLR